MTENNAIKIFEDKRVRTVWDTEQEKWFVSIVDVVEILSNSINPRRYWSDLKMKLEKEGSQLYENIVQLKMQASDGKMRLTDVADIEQVFRLIQSIPSPKAEPFKMWLVTYTLSVRESALRLRSVFELTVAERSRRWQSVAEAIFEKHTSLHFFFFFCGTYTLSLSQNKSMFF